MNDPTCRRDVADELPDREEYERWHAETAKRLPLGNLICGVCSGEGVLEGVMYDLRCPNCNGKGSVQVYQDL